MPDFLSAAKISALYGKSSASMISSGGIGNPLAMSCIIWLPTADRADGDASCRSTFTSTSISLACLKYSYIA
jgi:hypothetical protein